MAEKKTGKPGTHQQEGITRRTFIKNTGLITGGLVSGGLLGGLLGNQLGTGTDTETSTEEHGHGATHRYEEARMFFKRQGDFRVLEMVTETIFPEDGNGPGAIALGVPYFIDRQLAGNWGSNTRDYMQGPFEEGTDTQGYQSSLTRGEIFLQGIRLINQISTSDYDEAFVDLEEQDRVAILTEFSEGNAEMRGVSSSRFFSLLRQAVLEGAYCDPLYGGNREMAGWRMKGHPGSVMSYLDVIQEEDFVEMDPVALKDHNH
ncbi:gluconate 2-dehydrogenase subunit 3 family protein [Geomicrobium sp. JCM 19038]|uniref:gluconate 2-dehydrogenase subunit 3 family protein n=1 Tax=Geomicrobium sp. JCM 19038 TaxID=1460635 RepID=UPI00045F4A14|nr:gluconate 2-dehydrogenase subunit 3 family protein [Geomicrobium sp. JCM 19038]GAK08009.1 gluconate 2-dehydrogenase, membrane-bound, gamma subunit [Geomicrobium sp. JCM 19038]